MGSLRSCAPGVMRSICSTAPPCLASVGGVLIPHFDVDRRDGRDVEKAFGEELSTCADNRTLARDLLGCLRRASLVLVPDARLGSGEDPGLASIAYGTVIADQLGLELEVTRPR